MAAALTRKRIFAAGCILVLLAALRIGLDHLAGVITREVFAWGTGCAVRLADSSVSFFPLAAETRAVSIVHPDEGPEGGFHAERVRVTLAFLPLFKKQVVLKELVLEQSRVDSRGENTGFIKTLEFLFADKDKIPKPPSWHDPLTAEWKVWVQEILISTPDKSKEALRVGIEEAMLLADTVTFKGHDPTGEPIQPVEVTVEAAGVSVLAREGEEFRRRPLGWLTAKGGMGAGRVRFDEVVVSPNRPGSLAEDKITAHGNLLLGDKERYDVSWSAELSDEYLQAIAFGDRAISGAVKGRASLQGMISGDLTAPVLNSQVNLQLQQTPYVSLRAACLPREISAELQVSNEALHLSSFSFDDVLQEGNIHLDFDNGNFSGELTLSLNQEKQYLQRCVGSESLPEQPSLRSLTDAIADSRSTLQFSGGLNPPTLTAEMRSELYLRDSASRSNLQLKFDYAAEVVSVVLRERGVVPQVQTQLQAASAESLQTTFTTAFNSNIDAELRYDLGKQELNVRRLEISRYPTRRIIARLAPFISEENYQAVAAVTKRESLTDLSAELNYKGGSFETHGFLELTISDATQTLPGISTLHLSLLADGHAIILDRASLRTQGGGLTVRGSYTHGGELKGTFEAEKFLLSRLHQGRALPWLEGALLDGALQISGPLHAAKYQGELELSLPLLSGTPVGERIGIRASGDSESLRLFAAIPNERGEVSLIVPLQSEAELELDARLNRFPLSFLSKPQSRLKQDREETLARLEEETTTELGDSRLTGVLTYRGKLAEPLLGEGKLHVDELVLRGDGFNLRHEVPLRAKVADGRLTFEEVILTLQRRPLIIEGFVDREEGWDARIHGNMRLGRYLSRIRDLEQASGSIALDLHIEGPWDEPSVRGPVTLSSGSVSVPVANAIVGLEDIEARGELSGGNFYLESAEGRIGGGLVTANGSITELFEPRQREMNFEFSFENIVVEPFPNTVVQFGGPLQIMQEPGEPLLLKGTMNLDAALYEDTIDYTEILETVTSSLLRRRASVAEVQSRTGDGDTAPAAVRLDLQIRAENGLLLDTNFAEIEMGTNLHLLGSAASPRFHGTVEAVEGSFGLNNAVFELVTGSLTFTSEERTTDPKIQIVGESPVRTMTGDEQLVRMVVSGRLSDPQVHFSSDGGLSEQEIIALLTGGSGIGGLSIIAKKERDYTFRELISPASNLGIGDRFAGLTGFSGVEIKTELSRTTGEFIPSVVATRSVTNNLNLDVKTELGGERVSELNLVYPLTPYLDLLGGWKSRPVTTDVNEGSGSYEAGIRYRRTFSGFVFWRPAPEKRR